MLYPAEADTHRPMQQTKVAPVPYPLSLLWEKGSSCGLPHRVGVMAQPATTFICTTVADGREKRFDERLADVTDASVPTNRRGLLPLPREWERVGHKAEGINETLPSTCEPEGTYEISHYTRHVTSSATSPVFVFLKCAAIRPHVNLRARAVQAHSSAPYPNNHRDYMSRR